MSRPLKIYTIIGVVLAITIFANMIVSAQDIYVPFVRGYLGLEDATDTSGELVTSSASEEIRVQEIPFAKKDLPQRPLNREMNRMIFPQPVGQGEIAVSLTGPDTNGQLIRDMLADHDVQLPAGVYVHGLLVSSHCRDASKCSDIQLPALTLIHAETGEVAFVDNLGRVIAKHKQREDLFKSVEVTLK